MLTKQLHNYLRTHRKKAGFTQKEIAFLIGSNQVGKISRYEKLYSIPHLRTVLAYQVIFQVTTRELFGHLFEEIEKEAHSRAAALTNEVSQRPATPRNRVKMDHLRRLTITPPN